MRNPPRWLAKISWAGIMTLSLATSAQASPTVLRDIAGATSAERIEADIQTLVNFGTRHTLSETVSDTRGIGGQALDSGRVRTDLGHLWGLS